MLWLDKIVVQIHGQKKLQSCPQHIDILSVFFIKKPQNQFRKVEFDIHSELEMEK